MEKRSTVKYIGKHKAKQIPLLQDFPEPSMCYCASQISKLCAHSMQNFSNTSTKEPVSSSGVNRLFFFFENKTITITDKKTFKGKVICLWNSKWV